MTASESEFLSCFGVEPRLLDSRASWLCNEASYVVETDGYTVTFTIIPDYPDVRICVMKEARQFFEFSASAVRDVRIIDELGVDAVEVVLDGQSWLRMQLRPNFQVSQRFVAEGLIRR